ncbi:MAG: hypothetical protein AAGA71_06085 [Pseudomonadota bacterium]
MIYTAFGLTVQCEFELRDVSRLYTSASDTPYDVTIKDGTVPDSLADATIFGEVFEKNAEHVLLRVKAVADFLISNGKSIVISRCSGCLPDTLETYLFGSVFGILLQQRGVFSLHVGAVETRQGLVAFCGPTGAGKSTIVSELHQQTGCPIFCDDVAAVSMVDGVPHLEPGAARIKLCSDALHRFGFSEEGLVKDHTGRDKYKLPLKVEESTGSRRLHALFGLSVSVDAALVPLTGAIAFSLVHSAFYRPQLFDLFGSRAEAASLAAVISRTIKVFRFERTWSSPSAVELVSNIIQK